MVWRRKDLLGLRNLSAAEIEHILDTAARLKTIFDRPIRKVPALRSKAVFTLFYEASTRTRSSFDTAAKMLSADTYAVSPPTSSVTKGEGLMDTVLNLEAIGADAIIIRHGCAGAPELAAEAVGCSVLNAGDGMHEHPTQALLDMFTIRDKKGGFKGLKVVIIGDILHSRVAKSNVWGLCKCGAEVVLCGPPTLLPPELAAMGATIEYDLDRALEGADVINVLRLQVERQARGLFPTIGEYSYYYGVNTDRLRLAKPNALLMHPGPMNRGVEIRGDVADGERSVILEQVRNGVAVRMALLYLLLGGVEVAVD
ncbi:MAG: aspartate carbamoyltransferase catalytic subunit [bacterium]|jgi:aspartate carbamoyltransferase catalytic subunit|nr:aspartate carbamoyltransferase catalytic subunit [bacterium]MDD3805469.1 aspartate carbamoyltransferase catalytic subunit [bacterium]MDD4557817.1 aspartate carbamoyltransferase catalytic subunit [bacterium]